MDGIPLSILLQHQHTGTLGVIRILFDHYPGRQTGQQIANKDSIIGQSVISMSGDTHLILSGKFKYSIEYLAHG